MVTVNIKGTTCGLHNGLLVFQRLVKSLYLVLIANYSQLHDCEYH